MFATPSLRIFIPVLVIISTASCNSFTGQPLPTVYPTEYIPTFIAMTVEAQGIKVQPRVPEAEVTETVIESSPTTESPATEPTKPTTTVLISTPVPIPPVTQPLRDSPPPANIPLATIQILNPGPASKVTSPFILRAATKPGPKSTVIIELLGEDGRLLMREVRSYQSLESEWISLGVEVEFGINAVAEAGRIQIGVLDEQGRLKSLNSIDLILLSMGNKDLNQPTDQLENIFIESPRANTLIQGGTMRVSGHARLRSTQPLRIEILTNDGRIVGTRQVSITPTPGSAYGTFAIDVPYSIDYTSKVRLQIWEPGERIPGPITLSSLEVILSP